MTPTIGTLVDIATTRLTRAGLPEPRRDAAEMVARVLGMSRLAVLVSRRDPAPPAAAARLRRFVARRARRVPLDYVLGDSEFMGLTFAVRSGVFVPRPETELLVEEALGVLRTSHELPGDNPGVVVRRERHRRSWVGGAHPYTWLPGDDPGLVVRTFVRRCRRRGRPSGRPAVSFRVAEAGTGSGCIAVSLAVLAPRVRVWATEISRPAIRLARENAKRHSVAGRVRFFEGDLLEPLLKRRAARPPLDMVVANPPYVPAGDVAALPPEVRQEPRRALDGGPDGLDAVRRLADQSVELLKPGGAILLEIGSGQGAAARAVLEHRGYRAVTVRRDLAGHDRVLQGVWGG